MNTCTDCFRRTGPYLCRAAWHAFAGARELAIGLFHAANGVRLAAGDMIVRFRRARAAAQNRGSHVSR